MWVELSPIKTGTMRSVNFDHVIQLWPESTIEGTVLQFVDGTLLHVAETYGEVRHMIYPKSTERAAPVYVDTSR